MFILIFIWRILKNTILDFYIYRGRMTSRCGYVGGVFFCIEYLWVMFSISKKNFLLRFYDYNREWRYFWWLLEYLELNYGNYRCLVEFQQLLFLKWPCILVALLQVIHSSYIVLFSNYFNDTKLTHSGWKKSVCEILLFIWFILNCL